MTRPAADRRGAQDRRRSLSAPARPRTPSPEAGALAATACMLSEVDHERDALEPVALAEAVLEEERVVARHARAVRDLDREARRPHVVLGQVQQAEAPAAHVRGLAGGLEVGQEAVEVGGRQALARAG